MNQDSAAFIRAIKGPILMITVGALFALDNFTPFGFSRTWPVLLIVLGILSLGSKAGKWEARGTYRAEWGPPRPPRPSRATPSSTPPPTPPPPPPAAETPAAASTAAPGSYRGSVYEANPAKSAEDRPAAHADDPGATQ
jgi:hypothetical protein